jgi:hypothetical protein
LPASFLGESYSFQPGTGLFLEKHVTFSATSLWLYWCSCHPRNLENSEMRLPFCLTFHWGSFQETTMWFWWRSQKVIPLKNNPIYLKSFPSAHWLAFSWILNGNCLTILYITTSSSILPRSNHYLISWSFLCVSFSSS